jgi:hypothetical protein
MSASGFHTDLSAADFSNLQSQIADAVQFVGQNRGELARLVGFPGVEDVSVDFGIEERDVAAQSERFPPNLLRMQGSLGICLEFTLYPRQQPAWSGNTSHEEHRALATSNWVLRQVDV